MADDDELFSREEVLSGRASPGDVRRARAILYLIEQEAQRSSDRQDGLNTVAMAAASGMTVDLAQVLDPETLAGALPGERDEAFLASFRAARRGAETPELKRLERFADDWKVLLPERLDLRVRLFSELANRYELDPKRSKQICAAFGTDDPEFAAKYERLFRKPLDSAFVQRKGFFGRKKS